MTEGYQLKLSKDEAHALRNCISYCMENQSQEETSREDYLLLSEIHELLVKHGA
jgi:hypothetical protein